MTAEKDDDSKDDNVETDIVSALSYATGFNSSGHLEMLPSKHQKKLLWKRGLGKNKLALKTS